MHLRAAVRFRRWSGIVWALALLAAVAPASAADQPAGARVVNVTSDSAQGWTPSVEQERVAAKTVDAFLAALDGGRPAEAYAMLNDVNRREQSLASFSADLARFNKLAGPVRERRVLKITWTKDSPRAPFPGTFVAIDLLSRFEGVDRHCGYIVLHQAPTAADFRVTRREDAFIDNATAARITKTGKAPTVEALWADLSANCPNYPRELAPLPEQSGSIGYASVADALAALRAQPGVTFAAERGWTIATDRAAQAIWSFAPADHAAYPSAVKRQVVDNGGKVSVEMKVLCQASKAACDDLVREFDALNAAALGGSRR
jgi:hypothetical protein